MPKDRPNLPNIFGHQTVGEPPYISILPDGTSFPSAASIANTSDPQGLLAWLEQQAPGATAQFLLSLITRRKVLYSASPTQASIDTGNPLIAFTPPVVGSRTFAWTIDCVGGIFNNYDFYTWVAPPGYVDGSLIETDNQNTGNAWFRGIVNDDDGGQIPKFAYNPPLYVPSGSTFYVTHTQATDTIAIQVTEFSGLAP